MPAEENNYKWFAIQVRTRWEASTAVLLDGKGFEVFLPTYKASKRWGGHHRKEHTTPLFPGYVFCRFDACNRLPILITPGVIAVVGRGKVPLPVDDNEVSAIQAIVASGFRPEPWPFLELGQRVRIDTEPLRGLEGILLSVKGGSRIVLSVSLLRRSVALEIDRSCVTPVGARLVSADHAAAHRVLREGMA
jgi:transcription antitermination factor NusG